MKVYPYACLNIDCSWSDWLQGVKLAMQPPSDPMLTLQKIKSLFGTNNEAVVTLSVRTGLDLYLQCKNFPKGSEVLMSAINIPDVVTILRYHGLIPVPVDISTDTLEMDIEILE